MSINNIIPIDKLSVLFLIPVYLKNTNTRQFNTYLSVLFLICSYCLIGYTYNSDHSILIFYPILFIFLSVLAGNLEQNPNILITPLKFNIAFGIFAVILAVFGIYTPGCIDQLGRGIAFIPGPVGFMPTIQVYGTLCISLIILLIETGRGKSIWMYIACAAIFVSLNRASLVFLFLILLMYRPKTATFVALLSLCAILYFDTLYDYVFSISTLISRSNLRLGAELSYWNSDNTIIHLFGRGTHMTSEFIASRTIWERRYIENGIDFLFHSYGFFGFMIYSLFTLYVFYVTIKARQIKLLIFSIYYYLIEQILTNEFLSPSICFFSTTIFFLSKNNITANYTSEKNLNNTSIR